MFAIGSCRFSALRGVLCALLLLEFFLNLPRAAACSCAYPRHSRQIFPSAGTVDFPTNGSLRILLRYGYPQSLAEQLPKEYRLFDATGTEVTLTAIAERGLITLTPVFGLRPHTRYTLEQVQAYDENGSLVEDHERFGLAMGSGGPQLSPVRSRRFLPVRTFTTAAGPAKAMPPRGTISKVGAYSRMGGGDCGPGRHFTVDYTLERALRPGEFLALESQLQSILFYLPADETLPTGGVLDFGDLLCEMQYFELGDRDGLRLVTMAPGGERRPGDTFFPIAESNTGHGRRRNQRPASPPDDRFAEVPARWFAPPLVTTPMRPVLGPSSCPHGLRTTAKWQLGEPVRRLEPTPLWLGERAVRILGSPNCDRNTLQLFERRGRLLTLPLTDGCARHAALAGQQIAVVTIPSKWNDAAQRLYPAPILLSLYDVNRPAPLWQRKLGDESAEKFDPFVVTEQDRLLLIHAERAGEQLLHFQIVSLRDGRPLTAVHSESGADYSPNLDAIFDGEQFVVAWQAKREAQQPHGLRLLRLSLDGKPESVQGFGGPQAKEPALTRTDAGFALAFVEESGMQLAQGARGQRLRTPFTTVSAGTPPRIFAPRLAARGDLMAIAWPAGDQQILVTVVDSAKAIARPLALTPPGTHQLGAITAHGDGFAINYNTWPRPSTAAQSVLSFAETLTCRTDPPDGPPSRIIP